MTGPTSGAVLRPLGLGEVLDRAVSLCVKHFLPLSLIVLVFAIPLAVVSFFATKDLAEVMRQLAAATTNGGKPADPLAVRQAFSSLKSTGWYAALIAFTFFVGPLPFAALISAVSQFYLGGPTSFADAYAVGLRRWLPLIGINLLYVVAFALAYVVIVLAVVFLVFGLTLLTATLRGVGIALDVVVGSVAILAMLAFFVVATLAIQISYFTCVVEGRGVIASFGRGVSRVFKGIGLRRSLLVGVVFAALLIGIVVVTSAGEMVFVGLLRSETLGTVYATLVRIATSAFTTAFIAIFYFDLRVREEGLDLQLAAQAVRAEPSPST